MSHNSIILILNICKVITYIHEYERSLNMKFYELIATIFLKKDTHFSQSSELIGKTLVI